MDHGTGEVDAVNKEFPLSLALFLPGVMCVLVAQVVGGSCSRGLLCECIWLSASYSGWGWNVPERKFDSARRMLLLLAASELARCFDLVFLCWRQLRTVICSNRRITHHDCISCPSTWYLTVPRCLFRAGSGYSPGDRYALASLQKDPGADLAAEQRCIRVKIWFFRRPRIINVTNMIRNRIYDSGTIAAIHDCTNQIILSFLTYLESVKNSIFFTDLNRQTVAPELNASIRG